MKDKTRPVALVTGASRGIGRAIARELAQTHHVILGGRNKESLELLAEELPSAEAWPAELTDSAALVDLAAGITELDALVHSAGTYTRGYVSELQRDQWVREFEINLFAPAELTRLLLPALRQAKGTVVFLNSGAGQYSFSRGAIYSGTKFALKTLADTLRMEERANGVRVTSVHPGLVDTDLIRAVTAAEGGDYDPTGYMTPETIADAVGAAVRAPQAASYDSITVRPAADVKPVPEPVAAAAK